MQRSFCLVFRNAVGTEAYIIYVEKFEAWEREVENRREEIRAKAQEAQETQVYLICVGCIFFFGLGLTYFLFFFVCEFRLLYFSVIVF